MYNEKDYAFPDARSRSAVAAHLANVYWWMTLALLISGVAAWGVGTSPELSKILIKNPGLCFILILAELGLVMGISFAINKISASTAAALFIAYSLLNGITLSFIFVAYSMGTIASAFAVTSATFVVMALVGTVTKMDLSGFGTFFLMLLIGLIVASIVNIFWVNDTLTQIINYVGVLIFTGLTAYDAQKVKHLYLEHADGHPESLKKVAILGALTLYLDFVNLFLFILRIFGRRD